MTVKAPVTATVARFNGSMALVIPDDFESAPSSVRDGHWVPRQGLKVGDRGDLTWHSTPSSGNWYFCLDRHALSPFLRANGVPCPVNDYIATGNLPTDPADRAVLRSAAEQARKWQAADTKRAGEALSALLDGGKRA